MSDPRRLSAIHEAGHAVIGRVLGLVCGHVTIEEHGDSMGRSILANCDAIADAWQRSGKWRDFDSAYRGRILACMAGREATSELVEGFEDDGGDADDRCQIAWMIDEIIAVPGRNSDSHEAMQRYEARLRAKARSLVRRHRNTIELVAERLLSRTTLSASAIDALIPARKGDAAIKAVRALMLPHWSNGESLV